MRELRGWNRKEAGIKVNLGFKTIEKLENGRGNIDERRLLEFAKAYGYGLEDLYKIRIYENEKLIQKIFTKVGLQIKKELHGISCFPLNLDIEDKKEIMCSRTFGGSIIDKSTLKESIAN